MVQIQHETKSVHGPPTVAKVDGRDVAQGGRCCCLLRGSNWRSRQERRRRRRCCQALPEAHQRRPAIVPITATGGLWGTVWETGVGGLAGGSSRQPRLHRSGLPAAA